MKTLRWPTSAGAQAGLHARKVPSWWVQAWLAGVGGVWAGGREADGTLTRVDRIPTADLPPWSAGQGGGWRPDGVVAAGGGILEWVAARAGERAGQQVRVEYVPPPRRGGGARGPPAPGELRASVVEGGELPGRVRAAVEERQWAG